jgi:hypothetical protein
VGFSGHDNLCLAAQRVRGMVCGRLVVWCWRRSGRAFVG